MNMNTNMNMNRLIATLCVGIMLLLAGCTGYYIEMTGEADADGLDYEDEQQFQTDPTVADTDGDGLTDGVEVNEHETDPTAADTDDDGLTDGAEINTYGTNPTTADSDFDGLNDGAEVNTHETDPTTADTDADGLDDGAEINEHETDPTATDTDGDGLNDTAELNTYRTDPTSADTDADGLDDDVEINEYGTEPTINDSDGDGLDDGAEIKQETLPNYRDTDGDGIRDGLDPTPLHKDRYVVIQNQGCDVSGDDLQPVADAFDTAPIPNPDGDNGITLRFLDERDSELYGAAPRGYHIARFQPSVTNQGGLVSGYLDYPHMYIDCSYDNDVVNMIFMHELGHASAVTGNGVDSTQIPFNEYQSVMNYNRPRDYIGYADRDWKQVAETTNSSHSPTLKEYNQRTD